MKKRLLSAALALAMVLTMLPLTAFAADGDPAGTALTESENGTSVSKASSDIKTKNDDGSETLQVAKGEYYSSKTENKVTTYYRVTGGVVAGGKYYNSGDAALTANASSVIVIGDNISFDLSKKTSGTSLSIDINGKAVTFSGTLNNTVKDTDSAKHSTLTGVTVTNSDPTDESGDPKGSIGGSISVNDQTFSFTATNAPAATPNALALTYTKSTATSGKTLSVTLTDSKVGAIKADYGAVNVKVTGKTADVAGTGEITVNVDRNTSLISTIDYGSSSIVVSGGKTGAINIRGKGTITLSDMAGTGAITLDGGKKDDKKVMPKWGGNFTVNVGSQCTTGEINECSDGTDGVITVNVTEGSGSTSGVKSIDLSKSATAHVVKVDKSTVGTIAMAAGTLTVSNGAHTGAITLGTETVSGKVTVNISDSTTTVEKLNATNAAKDSTINIKGGTFSDGTDPVTMPKGYNKATITGGTFGASIRDNKSLANVNYEIKTTVGSKVQYTYTSSFQDCVNAYKNVGSDKNNPAVEITVVGADSNADIKATFILDAPKEDKTKADPVVVITTDNDHGITLPNKINNKPVDTWYYGNNDESSVKAGALVKLTTDTTYSATTSSADNSSIVKVSVNATKNTENPGLSAALSGNTIKVSGALESTYSSGFVDIPLIVETALGNKYEITVSYAVTEKKLLPGTLTNSPLVAGTDNASIQVKGTSLLYALDGSGLTVGAGSVSIDEMGTTKASANVTGGAVEKDQLVKALEQISANFNGSPAVKEAANKELAKLSQNTVDNYIRQGKVAAWKEKNPGKGNPTESDLNNEVSDYDTLNLVLYLNIQATNWNKTAGAQSITLNITPYYRLDVVSTDKDAKAYTVKTGQSLSMTGLTGEYGEVEITLSDKLVGTNGLIKDVQWAHHGSYVYKIKDKKFTTTNGFSPFILNKVDPVVEVNTKDSKGQSKVNNYDNVQTALDETVEGDKVVLYPNYSKSAETYTFSGKARTIEFDPGLNGTFTPTFNGASVTAKKTNGNVWTVQLNEDTAAANARVTVGTASNGTATVNVSSARVGSTVTITVNPSNGYRPLAPTVRTNTGAAVSVTAGSNNTYTFVVPDGATSITVTPSFVQNTGLPFNDVAANAWYFDGVAYCYNNNLMQGYDGAATTFGINHAVTRAEVVTILWRLAGQPIETPRTTYTDVKSGEWHYNAISWATNHGYAKGYGDGRFGPNNPVQRQELVVFLHRYAGEPTVNSNLGAYSDGGGVESWAMAAMRWATSYSILSGTNSVSLNGRLNAYSTAYREQVAVTLQHYHQYYK